MNSLFEHREKVTDVDFPEPSGPVNTGGSVNRRSLSVLENC